MKKTIKKYFIITVVLCLILSLTACANLQTNLKLDVKDFLNEFVFNKKQDEASNIASTSTVESNDVDTYDKLIPLDDTAYTLSKYALPHLNDEIGGFKVKNIYDFDERNAKLVEFYHEKTGATAFLISNDDEDKYAAIGFNTLAYDDKGAPHVFEHACLGGSEKYPSANLFFEMINKTYYTFLNAFTIQCGTVYPMASLSEEQLFSFYKYYIDGVFNPNILKNTINFDIEAYRYILHDKNDDLDISGVVYSEMSAYEGDIMAASEFNAPKTLFKDSIVSSQVGGKISDIPSLTYEELVAFHEKYYVPSNMLILLYGDIDYEKYLKYTNDEYLVNYEKTTIDKEDKNYKPNSGFVESKIDFPVASGSSIEKGAVITYSVSLEDMTAYEVGYFQTVINELNKDDGPLANDVNEKLSYANYQISSNLLIPKPYLSIIFSNVNEDDKDIVKDIVESAFKTLVNNGISKENLDAYIDMNNMSYELKKDSHGFDGDIRNFYYASFMSLGDDLLGYFKYNKGIKDIEKRFSDGSIDKLIKKYFSNNEKSAICTLVPKPGLLEKNQSDFVEMLKNKKESISEEEIENLIKENKDYDAWVEENNKVSVIDRVRAASVSELPEYKAKCYAYEENIEGIRFIRSDIDDISYSYCDMLLDISGVPYEDVLKLKLISDLLLYLPTTNYDEFKLTAEFSRYAYSYGTGIENVKYANGGNNPYFTFSFMALNKNLDKMFELFDELMYETKFTDTTKLKTFASQSYSSMKQAFEGDPSSFASLVLNAMILPEYRYDLHIDGMDYMNYLKTISQMNDEELKNLLSECETLLYSIYNRSGMVCEIISDFKSMSDVKRKIIALTRGFKNEKIEKVDYNDNLKKYPDKVAIESNSYVNYNYIAMPLKENELTFNSKYYVIDNILNDKILYPEFRVKRGAYGAYSQSSIKFTELYTYRDPNLKETFDTFYNVKNMLKDVKILDEELEDYKLNAYSSFSYPLTKLGAATIAIEEVLQKWTEKRPERYLKYMQDVKNTSISDIEELKEKVNKLIEKGAILSVGGIESIENNIDIFEEIIYDYIKK